jgi:hypothetical protein
LRLHPFSTNSASKKRFRFTVRTGFGLFLPVAEVHAGFGLILLPAVGCILRAVWQKECYSLRVAEHGYVRPVDAATCSLFDGEYPVEEDQMHRLQQFAFTAILRDHLLRMTPQNHAARSIIFGKEDSTLIFFVFPVQRLYILSRPELRIFITVKIK